MPSMEGVNTCANCGRQYFYSEAGGSCPKCGCTQNRVQGKSDSNTIRSIFAYIFIIPYLPILLLIRLFQKSDKKS
jgi:hypothetical protein